MYEWKDNKHWRKTNSKGNIFLMRDHNWAFAAWEIGLLHGVIKPGSTVIHVDSHLDDVVELAAVDRFYSPIESNSDALMLATPIELAPIGSDIEQGYGMRIDNFIWPAIMRGTVNELIHVSDDTQTEVTFETIINECEMDIKFDRKDNLSEYLLHKAHERIRGREVNVERYISVEEFIIDTTERSMRQKVSKILDLDLDYFNDSNIWNGNPKLKDRETIKKNLIAIRDIYAWDLITVALSPEYCGGTEPCAEILDLFYEVFEVNKSQLNDW